MKKTDKFESVMEFTSSYGIYFFKSAFQSTKVLFTSNLSTNGALMVQKGLAYSIVLEGSVPFWDKEKIAYWPLYPELMANSVFAWKKQQPFSLAASKFIEHIKCFLGIVSYKN